MRYPLFRVIVRRLALSIPLLFVVSALTFVLVSFIPGDPAVSILGGSATHEQIEQLRHSLGLDLPVYEQYWHWLRDALQGNLGQSLQSGEPVSQELKDRIPVSLSLILGSLIFSLLVGVYLGALSAVKGGALSKFVDVLALLGFAVPSFWVGAELIDLLAVKVQLLPASGYVRLSDSPEGWLRSILLPIVAVSFGGIAALAKQTREAMLDTLGSEYITVARATGISNRSLIYRHALKNTSVRIATLLGLQAVALLGGTVVIESVFSLPGLGGLAASATAVSDIPTIQGVLVVYTLIVIVINLVIDVAYSWLNPRVGE